MNEINLAKEITKIRYGLQGIHEDYEHNSLEFYKAERDYYKSLVLYFERLSREILQKEEEKLKGASIYD